MPLPFSEQIAAAERIIGDSSQVALCLGAGISRRKLPLLAELIALAFRQSPDTLQASQAFDTYSTAHAFTLRLADKGITVSAPCTLDEFRALDLPVARELCNVLVPVYGDVFRDLLQAYPSKQELLSALNFPGFGLVDPDIPHLYIACLVIEGRITRILTTNWDTLIEKALSRGSSRSLEETVVVAVDQTSWLDRLTGANTILAKVHGCVTQYPTSCHEIVITTTDLHVAAAPGWRHDAVREFLAGRVLFCGYSGSDYTLMVPAMVIVELRTLAALPAAQYFVAEDAINLPAGANQLTGGDPDRHLRMYANDMFTSLYFAYIKKRFEQALGAAKQQTQPERAFSRWNDLEWGTARERMRVLLFDDLPAFLDTMVGAPTARPYEEPIGQLPIHAANLRQVFLEGRVPKRNTYTALLFDSLKDIVLLLLLSAVIDLSRSIGASLSIENSFAGITLKEASGATRKLMLVHGTYPTSVEPMVNSYISDIEKYDGRFPTYEVIVIPCNQYSVGKYTGLAPSPVLLRRLSGTFVAKRRFIQPDKVFETDNYAGLVAALKAELGV